MNKIDKYKVKPVLNIFLYIVLAIIGGLLAIKTYGISLILALFLFKIPSEKEKLEIISYGTKGERVTAKVLEKLPKRYKIINNTKVYKPSGYNQLDHIVIGPNGVFIIETKYHKGFIKGNDSDVKVLQKKITPGGKRYTSRFLNPTKQVQTHVNTVKRRMKSLGYEKASVVGMVYFSHHDTIVRLKSKINPVFSSKKRGATKLRSYIKRYRGNYRLNKADIKKIYTQL